MSLFFEVASVGPLGANSIILGRQHTVLVDPGAEAELIIRNLREAQVTPELIVLTHAHCDHIGAVERLADATGAKVCVHSLDSRAMSDRFLNLSYMLDPSMGTVRVDRSLEDGDRMLCGSGELRVIHTPGHTPGSICLLWQEDGEALLVSGDTLFEAGCGRTDFPGGDRENLAASLRLLDKLIPEGTKVIPGHGRLFTKG